MTTMDRYFELSDLAGSDEKSFNELISLFSEEAVLLPAGHRELRGKEQITEFFRTFFIKNKVTKHLWRTTLNNNKCEVPWAVAIIRDSGDVLALQGIDFAELDKDGHILNLKVQFKA